MGPVASLLLVIDRRSLIAGTACGVMLIGCQDASFKPSRVRAEDYDAFWLWANVRPQSVLDDARDIYVLALAIAARGDGVDIAAQRQAMPRVTHARQWMAVRVETLRAADSWITAITALAHRWEADGARLAGVQIDFDSATAGLAGYADVLRRVRTMLPQHLKLSVTGLLDWVPHGAEDALVAMVGIVDELVIQTYQDRDTLPEAERYLAQADRLPIPFRIGLAQNGRMPDCRSAMTLPGFRGFVIFLLNPA
jgi:hypothetical protein